MIGVVGHANWRATTITGNLEYEDSGFDHDYNFNLYPTGGAVLVNDKRYVYTEANGAETADNFSDSWWTDNIRDARDDRQIRHTIGTEPASVTGLLSLDCEHQCGVEIHPIYALAFREHTSGAIETWHVFARRFGNEGFCSHERHPLEGGNPHELAVFLPHAHAKRVNLIADKSSFMRDVENEASKDVSLSEVGLHLAGGSGANLVPPVSDSRTLIDGAVTVHWDAPSHAFSLPAKNYDPRIEPETAIFNRMASVLITAQRAYLLANEKNLRKSSRDPQQFVQRFYALYQEALQKCKMPRKPDCGAQELLASSRGREANLSELFRTLPRRHHTLRMLFFGSSADSEARVMELSLSKSRIQTLHAAEELHVLGHEAFYPTAASAQTDLDAPLSASDALHIEANLALLGALHLMRR